LPNRLQNQYPWGYQCIIIAQWPKQINKLSNKESNQEIQIWSLCNFKAMKIFIQIDLSFIFQPKVQRNAVHCFHHKPRKKHCISISKSTENTIIISTAMKVRQIKWKLERGEKYHSTHWSWHILKLQLKDGGCKHKKRIVWTWQTPHADLQRLQLGNETGQTEIAKWLTKNPTKTIEHHPVLRYMLSETLCI
jgi:hypothetical protein